MKKRVWILWILIFALAFSGCTGKKSNANKENLKPVDEAAAARIRYAISLLLDRNYIADAIGQAQQQPASSFVAMGMTDHDGSQFYENAGHGEGYAGYFDVSQQAYEGNYAKAIDILDDYYAYDPKTGRFSGFPTLTYLYNTSESHKAIGEYVQSVLGSVGITVNLENQEWSTFLNTRRQGDYDLARNGWVADFNDPICFLDMWVSTSGNNDIGLGRGEHGKAAIYDLDLTPYGYDISVTDGTWAQTYDVLIDTIKQCTDEPARYALMHLAEDMLMETGTVMPIYFYTDIYMLSDQVQGFYANPLGHKYFQNVTLKGGGKALSVCLSSEPETLDPALNATVDGATLVSHLFSGLARWAQDGTLVADCAQELVEGQVQPDGSVVYTYTLKEGLKWSDGKPLTAHDFVYAWQRAASYELAADYGYLFRAIRGYEDVAAGKKDAKLSVEAPDARTLQVTLNQYIPYWNELLAFPTYLPVRKDVAENEAWATDAATYVCNGAYRMTGWKHNSVITLEKNPHYSGEVSMPTIRFFLSDDTNNMLTNFKNGTWHLIDDVPTNEIKSLKKQYPEQFRVSGQIGTYYICWNVNTKLS